MLDADEVVSAELANHIRTTVLESGVSYQVKRRNYIWGKWLDNATGKDFQVRIFENHVNLRYHRPVHEQLSGLTRLVRLKGHLSHYPKISTTEIIEKQNKYTSLECESKDFKNTSYFVLFFKPFYTFISILLIKGAWRDGLRGLCWSFIVLTYEIFKSIKIIEKRNNWK